MLVAACLFASVHTRLVVVPIKDHLVHTSPPRPLLAHHSLLRVRGGEARGSQQHSAAHALGSERRELRQRLGLRQRRERRTRRRAMYMSCCGIVLLWIGGGTLFYSLHNGWPPSQAFFYAVDAGMSIGFCTAIAETSVSSRAFTVLYILLGASVVGGALALFVEDAVAGAASAGGAEYRRLLERDAFRRADTDGDGVLSYAEFGALLRWAGCVREGDEQQVLALCRKFDASADGVISYREFLRSWAGLEAMLSGRGMLHSASALVRAAARAGAMLRALLVGEHRIFAACAAWVTLG